MQKNLEQNYINGANLSIKILNILFAVGFCLGLLYSVANLSFLPLFIGLSEVSFANFFSWYLVVMTGVALITVVVDKRKSEFILVLVIAILGFVAIGLVPGVVATSGGATLLQKTLGRIFVLLLPVLLQYKSRVRKVAALSLVVCMVVLLYTTFFGGNTNTCVSNDTINGDCYIEYVESSSTKQVSPIIN